jgi:SAM-dependent methyltransferase
VEGVSARLAIVMDRAIIQSDFDTIARLSDVHGCGSDRYGRFVASLVPGHATRVMDIGCGLGGFAAGLAAPGREVVGVDLSPEMIARARHAGRDTPGLSFLCADFLESDFGAGGFDCVVSSAALHHMDTDAAVMRMAGLLRPGGRLIIHDLRADAGPLDRVLTVCALAHEAIGRLARTGHVRSPRPVREAWARHGAREAYLTIREARALAVRLLPGAALHYHWLWRYTIVWDRADRSVGRPAMQG